MMTTLDDRASGDLSPAKRELLRRRLRGDAGARSPIVRHFELDRAPLSPAQRGVWILDHFLGPIGLYNISQSVWLDGTLDQDALGHAVDDTIERHQVLRAHTPTAGLAEQAFKPFVPGALRVTDLTGVADDAREQAARDLAGHEAMAPFDLAQGPLIRVRLLRLADDRHLLVLTLHHLVCDERSIEVLQDELAAGYVARLAGRRADLPPLPVHYRDYAAWQAGRGDDDQLAYWREALRELPPVLEIPTDQPRRPVPTHQGGVAHLGVSADVRHGVHALADRLSCTTFAVLLSGFATLMHRYSGQAKIAVGTLLAGRGHTEIEDLIGLFARPTALVADFAGDPSFESLVLAMHQRTGAALAHQDVSFEQVVDAVRPARDLSANPLFQVLYQQEDPTGRALELPRLRVRQAEFDSVQAKVDLALFTSDDGRALIASLLFATDLFTQATADRMLGHFGRLLEDAVHRPCEPVSRLRLLPLAERTEQILTHNDTAADYPRDACLHELFEAQVAARPDAVALVSGGRSVTYGELDRRANQLAWHLRELGVRAETPVGICMNHGIDMIVALLGTLKAGGAYVPVDPGHPPDRLAYVLADTAAGIVITERPLAGLVADSPARPLLMDEARDMLARCPAEPLGRTTTPENLVYVMYTSGSTGRPKGVMISHRALNNYLWWAIDGYGLGGAHGAPMVGSIAFDLSVPNFFLPLIGGKDVTFLPPDRSQQALAELLLEPGDFSLLKITPAHLDVVRGQILAGPQATVTSVRTFVIGADEVKPETIAGWRRIAPHARLINEYGPTETVVGCSVFEIGDDFDPATTVSIGLPIANMTMYVLDQHLEPVPLGVTGELYIGGDGVARGYLGRPGLTADRFLPDPYGRCGSRLYRTGDLARRRADGNLEFLGRGDHQVKIRGYRIELGEVEAQLMLDPGVREAVVAAREDRPGIKTLAAYVVPEASGVDAAALRDRLRNVLPDYMVPTAFVLLEALPLSDGGKVDRRLLPAPDQLERQLGAIAQPRGEAEQILARLWAKLLDLPQIGIYDNFFELGADSLLAIQLTVRARSEGLAITPSLVFVHQTVQSLAAAAGQAELTWDGEPTEVAEEIPGEISMSPSQIQLLESEVRLEYFALVVLLDLRAPVPAADLEEALGQLVARHQALRLRLDREACVLSAVPVEHASLLRTVKADDSSYADIAEELRAGLDLANGPVLQAALIRGRSDRLMLAVHHLATDELSWRIMLEELAALWPGSVQSDAGRASLPPPGRSFSAWTAKLHELAYSAELAEQAGYWLDAPAAEPLPVDWSQGRNTADTVRVITTTLLAEHTRELDQAYRSSTAELALTAIALTLTAWTGRPYVTVEMTGHGRNQLGGIDPARTVGWLSHEYPLTLRPGADRSLGASLAAVSGQLSAVPGAGLGYSLMRYLRRDDIGQQLRARPASSVLVDLGGRYRTGEAEGMPFSRMTDAPQVDAAGGGARTYELIIGSAVIDGELVIEWTYSDQLHQEATIQRLADDCLNHLLALATRQP